MYNNTNSLCFGDNSINTHVVFYENIDRYTLIFHMFYCSGLLSTYVIRYFANIEIS